MFERMENTERIELAKAKMEKVIDHLLYVLELHANNAFVVYSKLLSSQIPTSFAANAFNVFQAGMHQIEIVRLCALWDRPHDEKDKEKESIPTVIELIADDKIIEDLADETRSHWVGNVAHLINPSSEPDLAAFEQEALKASNLQFGNAQAAKAVSELQQAIIDARNILDSPLLASIMNLRDKHLAHSLTATRREMRGPVHSMKYGDETALQNATIPIVERLFCWVNGKSFSIAESQSIDEKNAAALWTACKFINVS